MVHGQHLYPSGGRATSIRLFAPPRLPGRRRDPLGAPIADGAFEVDYRGDTRFAVRAALAEHKVGLVDPIIADELLMIAWWSLAFDRQLGAFVGPSIHFEPAAFVAPELQPSLPIAEALAAYLAAAPVPLSLPAGRIAVHAHRDPPSPTWRRTVRAPAWCGPDSAAWQEAARRARILPCGPALVRCTTGSAAGGGTDSRSPVSLAIWPPA